MRITLLLMLLLVATMLTGCLHAPVRPPSGLLFTQHKAPLTTDFDNTRIGSKTGRSSSLFFMEPFLGTSYAWGRAGIQSAVEEARKSGNIETVSYADYEYLSVLGIVKIFTVEAHGD